MKSKSINEHIDYIPEIDVATIQIKLQKYHYKTSSLQRDRFYQMSFLATTVGTFSLICCLCYALLWNSPHSPGAD